MQTSDKEGSGQGSVPPSRQRWLIAKCGDGTLQPLTLTVTGGQTLPVFSFEEEAEMFLWLWGLGDGWRVRPSGCGELVSTLYGPCGRVSSVALDPSPLMVIDGTLGLVSVQRERFVEHLLGEKSR